MIPCPHPIALVQFWGYSGEIEWCQRCGAIRGMGVDWMAPEGEPKPETITVEAVVVPDATPADEPPTKTERKPVDEAPPKPPSRTAEEAEEAQLLLRKTLRCDVRKGTLHYSMQLADIFYAKRDERWTKDEAADFKAEMAWSREALTVEEKAVVDGAVAGYTAKQGGRK